MNEPGSVMHDPEALTKEFREFAYSVSHDLGAPARAVVEFSRLLNEEQSEALSDNGKLYLSLIVENGQKLQAMLAGLLDYSRLNTMAKTLSYIDCNVVLEHCQIILQERIKDTGATLEILKLPKVKADAEQLMQLFLILLDNALKFHAPDLKPSIEILSEEMPTECVFKIRDNGIGIAPEFKEHIFKPFQRLHSDEEFPGIGMGLALAKKIVDRHGGNIWSESSASQGTTFFFTLPIKEGSHA